MTNQTTNTTAVTAPAPITLAEELKKMRLASIEALAEQEDSQVEALYVKISERLKKELTGTATNREKISFSVKFFMNKDVVVVRKFTLETFTDVPHEVMTKLSKKLIENGFTGNSTQGSSELLYSVGLEV